MTPAKRRPTRRTRAATKDSTQEGLEAEPEPTEPEETGVLGPDGRHLTRPAPETERPTEEKLAANEEAPTGDAGGDSAPTTETGQADPEPTPTVEEPVVLEPVVETPAAPEPTVEEPVVLEPVVETLAAAEPVVEEPAAEVPEAHAPTGSEPVPQEPAVREAATTTQSPGRSRARHPERVWPD